MQAQGSTQSPPFVSVIVPVYNDVGRIGTCLTALLNQTYPRSQYEIIVVDNGSDDGTPAVVRHFPVTLLAEHQTRSSYAARNLGMQHARGAVLAFTDSDCTPSPRWIAEGVRALEAHGADLAGGSVRFTYSSPPTGAEVFDSLSYLQVERHICQDQAAPTANLFVRASVFQQIGPFPAMQSGADIYWTSHATRQGFQIVYAPQAEVAHPARRLRALVKKQFRIGRGHHQRRTMARAAGIAPKARRPSKRAEFVRKIQVNLRELMPYSVRHIRAMLQHWHTPTSSVLFWRVWCAGWLARAAVTSGNLSRAVRR